jgi:predicted lysophospholipase L1 biosynthesis ABC-type transport system permease subunit
VLDTAGLVIWDIGTRSPLRLFADVRAGLRERRAIVRGVLRVVAGVLALLAAVAVSAPVATRTLDFTIIECWALVTALVVEGLVGPGLRIRRR